MTLSCTSITPSGLSIKQASTALDQRLHLLFMNDGLHHLLADNQDSAIQGPALLCLHEFDACVILPSSSGAWHVSLTPSILNEDLTFSILRSHADIASANLRQDRYYLLPFIHQDTLSRRIVPLDGEQALHIRRILERLHQELSIQGTGYWPCRSRSALFELLVQPCMTRFAEARAYQPASCMTVPPGHPLGPIVAWMGMHYREALSLKDVCHRFACNRTSLNHWFKHYGNTSFSGWIATLRLNEAAYLLRATGLPVARIAEQCGYADSTHLGRCFKARFGMSPARFREGHGS